MTDLELQAVVLCKFHERRGKSGWYPAEADFDPPLPIAEIDRIVDQLEQRGLLKLRSQRNHMGGGRRFHAVMGEITAAGVAVVEGDSAPVAAPLERVQQNNITIIGANAVAVGDNNPPTAHVQPTQGAGQGAESTRVGWFQWLTNNASVAAIVGGVATTAFGIWAAWLR